MSRLEKINQRILDKDYYLSFRAEDEMLDDDLNRSDAENAILQGDVVKIVTKDVRGSKYLIEGTAKDGRKIHVLCRYKENRSLIIITVYVVREGL